MADYDSEDGTPRVNLGTYEGERNAEGERHGHGSTVYPNEDRYEGRYKHGKRFGAGVYKFKAGGVYTGAYVLNKKHGHGKFQYKDGSEYEGMWANDQYAGAGVYTYPNEDWYAGQWQAHKKNGRGVYYFSDTKCLFRGEFADGEFVSGEWLFADGVYEGTFSKGRPIGRGIFKYKNGNVQTGEFVAGKGDARTWVLESFGYVHAAELECALDVDGAALREHYVALYSKPLFGHERAGAVQAVFDQVLETSPAAPAAEAEATEAGAQGEGDGEAAAAAAGGEAEAAVLQLDFVAALRAHAVASWGVPEDFFDQAVEQLPLGSRHFSATTTFAKFWEATQKLPDVVERFDDTVFKAERQDEVAHVFHDSVIKTDKDESGEEGGEEAEEGGEEDDKAAERAVNLLVLKQGIEALAAVWGYNAQAVSAQLSEIDFFVDINEESSDVLVFDDLWEQISPIQVEVVRSVPAALEPPPVAEAAPDAGAAAAGSPTATVVEILRAAQEAINALGEEPVETSVLRDTVLQAAAAINDTVGEEIAQFVDALAVFAAETAEPETTVAAFWAAVDAAAGAGAGGGAPGPAAVLLGLRSEVDELCVANENGSVRTADLRSCILEVAAKAGAEESFIEFVDSLPFIANLLAMDEDERDALECNAEEFWQTVSEAAGKGGETDLGSVLAVIREDVEAALDIGEDGRVAVAQLQAVLIEKASLVAPSESLADQIAALPAFAELDALSEDERTAVQIDAASFWESVLPAAEAEPEPEAEAEPEAEEPAE